MLWLIIMHWLIINPPLPLALLSHCCMPCLSSDRPEILSHRTPVRGPPSGESRSRWRETTRGFPALLEGGAECWLHMERMILQAQIGYSKCDIIPRTVDQEIFSSKCFSVLHHSAYAWSQMYSWFVISSFLFIWCIFLWILSMYPCTTSPEQRGYCCPFILKEDPDPWWKKQHWTICF